MSKKLEVIELKNILTNKGTQGRVTLDQGAIKDYSKDLEIARNAYIEKETAKNKDFKFDEDVFLQEHDPFPAVEVYRDPEGHIYLVDGFHRHNSKKETGFKKILCEVKEGTLRDAILRSTAVNQGHGVRRTQKDKRRAVEILIADKEWKEKSNNWIAEQAGVSEFLVRTLRPAADAGKAKTVRTRSGGTTKAAARGTSKAAKAAKGKTGKGKTGKSQTDGGKTGDQASDKADEEVIKLLRGIERAIGPNEGGTAFRTAVENGSLPLSKKDLKEMAAFSPTAQREILELVVGGQRMKPRQAYDFLKNPLPDKMLVSLELRATTLGKPFVFERNGFRLTFEKIKK